MNENSLQNLLGCHPSIWLSDAERSFIVSDQLDQWLADGIVQGLLASHTSLERSLHYTHEYDRDVQVMQQDADCDALALYHYIALHDMQLAADRLKQIYDKTQGWNGYVNLDLPPVLDYKTLLGEAQQLWKAVGWPNFMLKIPAVPSLLPTIQHLISQNININATLVISQMIYAQVAEAYLAGLEALALQGKKLNRVVSVASIPVRCFRQIIRAIEFEQQGLTPAVERGSRVEGLLGRVIVNQIALLNQQYQAIYHGDRWQKLAAQGARPQRLLWDMTGIDNLTAVTHVIESYVFSDTLIELSPDMLNALSIDHPHFNWTRNWIPDSETHYPNSRHDLNIYLESSQTQLLAEEMKRSSKDFTQLLKSIEQKLNQSI